MARKIKYIELNQKLEEQIIQMANDDGVHYNEAINVLIKDGFYQREQQRKAKELVEEVLGLSE